MATVTISFDSLDSLRDFFITDAAGTRASNDEVPTEPADGRALRVPPHVSIRVLRRVSGLKLDDVCELVEEATGDRPSRGTLSAIENGHRGASAELLAALEMVYGLQPGDITTNYVPRNTPHVAAEVSA